jgi:hypothetical protein
VAVVVAVVVVVGGSLVPPLFQAARLSLSRSLSTLSVSLFYPATLARAVASCVSRISIAAGVEPGIALAVLGQKVPASPGGRGRGGGAWSGGRAISKGAVSPSSL